MWRCSGCCGAKKNINLHITFGEFDDLILNCRIFDQADQCRRHIFARDLTIRNRQIGMNPTGTGFR